jgi:predicted AlkP superfamily phosphohydrolase/phosphomutase
VIPPDDYEKERDALAARLRAIRGPNGESWETTIIKPQEYFEELEGEYPDLMVYFDDLYWRSAGTLGYGTKYLAENDTGPDDAVHAQEGIYILADPRRPAPVTRNADILDIAPTVLDIMGIHIPKDMKGKVIQRS